MDTTPLYLEMCEKAVEVQKVWIPAIGDWYTKNLSESETDSSDDPEFGVYIRLVRVIASKVGDLLPALNTAFWLPRQDQLQEMVEIRVPEPLEGIRYYYALSDFMRTIEAQYVLSMKSMEQLWLALVMDQKHGKFWNGSDWIAKEYHYNHA